MNKSMVKMLTIVGIFFVLIFGWYGVKKIMFAWFVAHYKPPAITISATTVESKNWQSYLTAVGTLHAVQGVDLSSETPGVVEEIRFKSGQMVNQGDVVIVLRTTVEQAALKSNQAKLQLAKINYEREQSLFAKKVSSKATLDTRYAELLEAQSGVESIEAQIKSKTIVTPFAGRMGIRLVNLGQYISPGTPMVTLQSLNPLYVDFYVPEKYLADLCLGQAVDIVINIGKGKTVRGEITAINAKVEQTTRNVLIQATIPNDNQELYPGMYGFVKVWLKEKKDLLVVPQTAIAYSLSGNYVFLVKEEKTSDQEKQFHVYRQYITVGDRRDDEVSILSGLTPGDKIITSGQMKLQNGTPVIINNKIPL